MKAQGPMAPRTGERTQGRKRGEAEGGLSEGALGSQEGDGICVLGGPAPPLTPRVWLWSRGGC